ncbi:MAG TPA: deoxyribose-phosphate aldolase [Candidatus Limnocylindria bacterium]|jgi:deoxyribose-phosphate aldolase|nr:deoxyribose-phosphate aldolase [Candidatus Limnocylindria bacterium]
MPLLLGPASPPVDAVMLEARANDFAKRSIKGEAKLAAIDLAIRCIDLTTLEGRDTPGRVASLCAKAAFPAPGAPPVAAVCVYPNLVAVAKAALRESAVKVASVATAFPSGLSSLEVKLRDTEAALAAGADEIDMVIDRGAFLAGDEQAVVDEIVAVKQLCGRVHLKAILETGELGSYDAIRRASDLALDAGADVIKTSTGKIGVSATLPTALVMAEAIRDFQRRTGERRGLKIAGGVRTTKAALAYLVLIDETLGDPWLAPELFRIGASALLDDLLLQRAKLETGRYGSLDYIAKD